MLGLTADDVVAILLDIYSWTFPMSGRFQLKLDVKHFPRAFLLKFEFFYFRLHVQAFNQAFKFNICWCAFGINLKFYVFIFVASAGFYMEFSIRK